MYSYKEKIVFKQYIISLKQMFQYKHLQNVQYGWLQPCLQQQHTLGYGQVNSNRDNIYICDNVKSSYKNRRGMPNTSVISFPLQIHLVAGTKCHELLRNKILKGYVMGFIQNLTENFMLIFTSNICFNLTTNAETYITKKQIKINE